MLLLDDMREGVRTGGTATHLEARLACICLELAQARLGMSDRQRLLGTEHGERVVCVLQARWQGGVGQTEEESGGPREGKGMEGDGREERKVNIERLSKGQRACRPATFSRGRMSPAHPTRLPFSDSSSSPPPLPSPSST